MKSETTLAIYLKNTIKLVNTAVSTVWLSNFPKTLLVPVLVGVIIFNGAIATQAQEKKSKVIAKVNGTEITESILGLAERSMGANLDNIPKDKRRNVLINMLIDLILFSQKAEKKGFTKQAIFKHQMELEKAGVLRAMYIADLMNNATTEKMLKERYAKEKEAFKPETEVRARHILVSTEKQADEIYKQLKEGADFAKLAKEKSKDPTNLSGGDLGYFIKNKMIKEFGDVAFALEPGEISTPVKTSVGWHIIKLEEKRQNKLPTFEEMRPAILDAIRRNAYRKELTTIRDSAKIEILDDTPAAEKKK